MAEEGEKSPKIPELEKRIQDLQNGIGVFNKTVNGETNSLPEFKPNPHYPGLSEAVTIKFANERGRFGVASRDIRVKLSWM